MKRLDALAKIIGLSQPAVAVALKLDRNRERSVFGVVEQFLGGALR
jgi:hypothetical protein